MATEGKLPLLGFKAAAIKFVTLLGFSPSSAPAASPAVIQLAGSYDTTVSLVGSYAAAAIAGSYDATVTLEGSVGN